MSNFNDQKIAIKNISEIFHCVLLLILNRKEIKVAGTICFEEGIKEKSKVCSYCVFFLHNLLKPDVNHQANECF